MHKDLPPIPVNDKPPEPHRIAWWFENTIIRSVKRLYNTLGEPLRNLFSFSLIDWIDDLENGLLEITEPWLNELENLPGLPEWFREIINRARAKKHQAGLFVVGVLSAILVSIVQGPISTVIGRRVLYTLNKAFHNQLIDVGTVLELERRALIPVTKLYDILKYYGYDDEAIEMLHQMNLPLVPDDILTQMYWRKEWSPERIRNELYRRGYRDDTIFAWAKARQLIPSYGDLISIAVREGFDDAVAQQFGYDEAFPIEAAEWAEKQGLAPEWFRRMWRAHWRLPSTTQGYEMYHRGIISRDELELLLRASDIPSFWREKLIEMSRRIVTRVDVRRMYSLGVISEEDVYKEYIKQGYSEEDAEKLTLWTIAEYSENARDLTKSDILAMYREGILNSEEAREFLSILRYSDYIIDLLLMREDLKAQREYENDIINAVKKLYTYHRIDRNDAYARLAKLDMPATYIDRTLELWRIERESRIKEVTKTDLKSLYRAGLIDDQTLEQELKEMGYSDKAVRYLMALWVGIE